MTWSAAMTAVRGWVRNCLMNWRWWVVLLPMLALGAVALAMSVIHLLSDAANTAAPFIQQRVSGPLLRWSRVTIQEARHDER